MATFSLDQLKADVEKNYATLSIEVGNNDKIELRNMLRVERDARAKLMDKLDELDKIQNDEEISSVEKLDRTTALAREALTLAAGKRGGDLIALIGDDDALVMEVLSKWTESTQAGEAEPSSE